MPELLQIREPERKSVQHPPPELAAFLGMGFRPLRRRLDGRVRHFLYLWRFFPMMIRPLPGPAGAAAVQIKRR